MRELPFDVDDPALPFLLTLVIRAYEGRLACGQIEVRQRSDGPPVTGAGLRSVTIDSYISLIRQGLTNADLYGGMVLVREADQIGGATAYDAPSEEDLKAFDSAPRQRIPLEEMLPLVASAYRAALADPVDNGAPTLAVARRLGISRGHAARLVAQARQEGLLGAARPGTGGEVAGIGIGKPRRIVVVPLPESEED